MIRRALIAVSLVLLTAHVAGCSTLFSSRSYDLSIMWEDPWGHHERDLDVRIYPYDVGEGEFGQYLVCRQPCEKPATNGLGNTWVYPLDPSAFRGWNGTRSVRMRVKVDASSFAPDAVIWGHFPIHLAEVGPETSTDPR